MKKIKNNCLKYARVIAMTIHKWKAAAEAARMREIFYYEMKLWRAYIELLKEHKEQKKRKMIWNFIEQKQYFYVLLWYYWRRSEYCIYCHDNFKVQVLCY